MKLDQLFESAGRFKGQTSVGTKLIAYRTVKRGTTFHITVSSQGKSVGSIKVADSKVTFTDHLGKVVSEVNDLIDDLNQRSIESILIPELINHLN